MGGYAGISAANVLHQSNISFHVLEANAHVGGRTRNFDLLSGNFDVVSDDVVELGGTFVSPGHTALIDLVHSAGLDLYNVSKSGGANNYRNGRLGSNMKLREPADAWPWWWFGVDTNSKMLPSTFFDFKGSFLFRTSSDLRTQLDKATLEELDSAGRLLTAAADSINCTGADSMSWAELDGLSFEAWIREHVLHEEGRVLLRAMCRGMIAQEASQVSLLYTVRSLKGCWSTGDDDQYRIRGGSQGPLLRLSQRFSEHVSLSAPVTGISWSRILHRWVVSTKNGAITVAATHVIVTGPPPAILAIDIPSLGWVDSQLLQRMPMGTSLKYFLVYDKPWWRTEQGLSGQIIASKMPSALNATHSRDGFTSCMEHSAFSGMDGDGKGVLMCWIEGECNLHFLSTLSEEERRNHVLAFVGLSLRDARVWHPERVIAHNWASQTYARGAYTMFFPPGVQSQPAFWEAYAHMEKSKGLWLAGSDYQLDFGNGYMEGAVRSGQAVAKTIVKRLQTNQEIVV